jgi:hypothetical protein
MDNSEKYKVKDMFFDCDRVGDEAYIVCPKCKDTDPETHVHYYEPKFIVSKYDPYDYKLVIPVSSECGHSWKIVFTHVNGETIVSIKDMHDEELY